MKIFVTVGTGSFDELVRAVDNLKLKNCIIQIGSGKYVPKNCKWFRFKDSIKGEIKAADLIISHGGAGTLLELLYKNKKVIGVVNLDRTDDHQFDIVKKLSKDGYLIWCKDLRNLRDLIKSVKLARGENRIKVVRTGCFGACRFRAVANIYENTPRNGNFSNNGIWLKNTHKYSDEKWVKLFELLSNNEYLDEEEFERVPMSEMDTYKNE